VSMSRKPAAPERSAVWMYSSVSKVVSMATYGAAGMAWICRRTERPSTSGMRMSSTRDAPQRRRTDVHLRCGGDQAYGGTVGTACISLAGRTPRRPSGDRREDPRRVAGPT
jgi:hypothetical protein